MADAAKHLKPDVLEKELRRLLAQPLRDDELLRALEPLAKEPSFPGFTWLWGPELYRRSRVLFRPFVLAHFGSFLFSPPWTFKQVEWKGEPGKHLEPWFAQVDRDDDVALFGKLYTWRLHSREGWRKAEKRFREDLAARFVEADSPGKRQTVLAKFNFGYPLDERTAAGLYRVDPVGTPRWILRHLPHVWSQGDRTMWDELGRLARERGDDDFHFRLYRLRVPIKQWQAEVLALADRVADPPELVRELDRRHPQGFMLDLGEGFLRLVEKRGRDVLPYVMRRIRDVGGRRGWLLTGRTGYEKLLELARAKAWHDLWALLVRAAADPKHFNAEIRRVVDDRALDDAEAARRLRLVAGMSRELNFPGLGLAQLHPLEDDLACTLHARLPDLLRGPFRAHVLARWGSVFPKLTERVLSTGDGTLLDHLASRLATRGSGWGADKEGLAAAERLSKWFEELRARDAREFSRRAGSVLGLIPAYAIFSYDRLVRENRLARLLFERSPSSFLDDGAAVRDLVEAAEIHVQALAYRVLGLDDPRARTLAAENLDLLLGTLLRPLHRRTRAAAFRALANAAHDRDGAGRILRRAREAFALPDKKYPKEALLGLVARVLARWPELRSPAEQPRVFERAPA